MKITKKTLVGIICGFALGFYLKGCDALAQDYQVKYNYNIIYKEVKSNGNYKRRSTEL